MTEQQSKFTDLTVEEKEYRHLMVQATSYAKAKNGIIPKAFMGDPAAICVATDMARSFNINPFALMRGMYFVHGKPVLMGDTLLAIAYANGCKVVETGGENDNIGVYASCSVWRAVDRDQEKPTVTVIFSQDDAIKAGLWESNDVWKKFPTRMLRMRARGWALRDAIPDLLAGAYAEGELPGEPIDITPQEDELGRSHGA